MVTLRPGDICYLPPDNIPGADPKTRPHVLVSQIDEDSEAATLAFCSGQPTEADAYGAPYFLAHGPPIDYRTGFKGATYVYCSRLVVADPESVVKWRSSSGDLRHELHEIRKCLRIATGIGSGAVERTGSAKASLRGRVIELTPAFAARADARYAVVTSNPAYSREQRYLNIVPLYDADDFYAGPDDVVVDDKRWTAEIGLQRAIVAVPLIQHVYYPEHVSRPTPAVMDGETLQAVDDKLVERFQC